MSARSPSRPCNADSERCRASSTNPCWRAFARSESDNKRSLRALSGASERAADAERRRVSDVLKEEPAYKRECSNGHLRQLVHDVGDGRHDLALDALHFPR